MRKDIQELNWNKVGVARQESDLAEALSELAALRECWGSLKVSGAAPYNMMYNTALDLRSMIDVSEMTATSARLREESRGAHYRQDFPKQRDDYGLFNIFLRRDDDGRPQTEKKPVAFPYKSVEECQRYRK